MIKSVVRSYNWTPETVGSLYLDDEDFDGLEYWYNDVCDAVEEIKNK